MLRWSLRGNGSIYVVFIFLLHAIVLMIFIAFYCTGNPIAARPLRARRCGITPYDCVHRPLERALAHVQKCRTGTQPNDGFMKQLKAFEASLSIEAAAAEACAAAADL